ncbi:MAG: hypothetical protein J0L80_17110 [Chitinophagales bacterium]|nr:hypothetical protein [Chitinophagales bacterium]
MNTLIIILTITGTLISFFYAFLNISSTRKEYYYKYLEKNAPYSNDKIEELKLNLSKAIALNQILKASIQKTTNSIDGNAQQLIDDVDNLNKKMSILISEIKQQP